MRGEFEIAKLANLLNSTEAEIHTQIDRHAQTIRQTHTQTDRQTDTHTRAHTSSPKNLQFSFVREESGSWSWNETLLWAVEWENGNETLL